MVWLGSPLQAILASSCEFKWPLGFNHLLTLLIELVPPFFLGVTSFLLLSVTTTMLTEFMPGRSASGVAINNLCRNMLSFAGSLVAIPWINAIGVGWTMTIVAALMLSSSLGIWLIAQYGAKWRTEMDKKLSR
jgi:hypothetical protein